MDAVDDVILAAVRARWATDATLPTIVDRPPQAGRAHSAREQPLPDAYAVLECKAKASQRYSKAVKLDRRALTMRCYAPKDKASAALQRMQELFSERMGSAPPQPPTENSPLAPLPDGWVFVSLLHDDAGTLREDEDVRAGQDVWVAEMAATVTVSRPEGV
jgi:hypothetical protein